jgi:hypothetical protein
MKVLAYWLAAAWTVFANGFIHGVPAGVTAASVALKAGKPLQVAALIGSIVAATNAGKRVLVWSDANPVPNPFPAPTAPVAAAVSPSASPTTNPNPTTT